MKKKIAFIIICLIKYLPFLTAMKIRGRCYKVILKSMGKGTNITDAVTITHPSNVSIGDYVSIHEYSYIAGAGDITIGNYCAIANNCSIISVAHNFQERSIPIKRQGHTPQPVVIGNNVWIGSKVTILGNVRIGDGAIIGAGSVVTRNIPENAIAMGVPCRVKRFR